jgi:hypothetical protein
MKRIEDSLPHSYSLSEGWTVHVYSSDRRLLCTLNSSHCWSLFAGLVLGMILTLSWAGQSHPNPAPDSASEPASAPLSID